MARTLYGNAHAYEKPRPKGTTIGRGKRKSSSLNKHKKRCYKPYNRQGN